MLSFEDFDPKNIVLLWCWIQWLYVEWQMFVYMWTKIYVIRIEFDPEIIIIMSCRQHGYPWPSPATSPYHSLPPAGLQGYILCPHIVAVCKFELVVLLLHGHMWGSIGVHHLWARPCFYLCDDIKMLDCI